MRPEHTLLAAGAALALLACGEHSDATARRAASLLQAEGLHPSDPGTRLIAEAFDARL